MEGVRDMIYDTLNNLSRYKGIHPNLDIALVFLAEANLNKLKIGKTVIDGEKVFINVMEASLKEKSELAYEFHKEYLDIQLDIEGEEQIGIGNFNENKVITYDPQIDFGTIVCEQELFLPLGENRFIICMLNEPHKPSIQSDNHSIVKKCVVKILIE